MPMDIVPINYAGIIECHALVHIVWLREARSCEQKAPLLALLLTLHRLPGRFHAKSSESVTQ